MAINQNFDTSAGGPYLSKGNLTSGSPAITDNAILTNVGANACVQVHAYSTNQSGSTGVEIQWNLSGTIDMSGQNFTINFDIYVPAACRANMTAIQWEFYTPSYSPIYSVYYTSSVVADTWCHISSFISNTNSIIGYASSSLTNTASWTNFSKVRIQFVSSSTNQDTIFYLDNLAVSNLW